MGKKKSSRERAEQAFDEQYDDDDSGSDFDIDSSPVALKHASDFAVRHIAFLPGDDRVVTCDAGGVTHVFDRLTGECIAKRRTERRAECEADRGAEREAAGGAESGGESVSDIGDASVGESGGESGEASVGAAQVVPLGGALLATLMDDGSICLWDFEAGEVLFEGEVAGCDAREMMVVLCGLGIRGTKTGEAGGEDRWGALEECFVGGTNFGALMFLRHKRGRELQFLKHELCHERAITSIAVWGSTMVTGSADKFAVLMNWNSKEQLAVLGETPEDSGVHDCSITGVDISAESVVTVAAKHDGHGAVRVYNNSAADGFHLADEWRLKRGLGKCGVISLRGSALMAQAGNRLGFTETDRGEIIGDWLNVDDGHLRHAGLSRDGFVAICGGKTTVSSLSRIVKTEMTQNVDYLNPFLLSNALVSEAASERWESASALAKVGPALKDESRKVPTNGVAHPPASDPRHSEELDLCGLAKALRLADNDDAR